MNRTISIANLNQFGTPFQLHIENAVIMIQKIYPDVKQFYIYGSYIRSHWTKEKISDIDLIGSSKVNRKDLVKNLSNKSIPISGIRKCPINIHNKPLKTPADIMKKITFNMDLCVYSYPENKIYYELDVFRNISIKTLYLSGTKNNGSLNELWRTFKYTKRGFLLPVDQLITLHHKLHKRKLILFIYSIIYCKSLKNKIL